MCVVYRKGKLGSGSSENFYEEHPVTSMSAIGSGKLALVLCDS